VGWLAAAIPAGYLLYYASRAFGARLALPLTRFSWFPKHRRWFAVLGFFLLLAVVLLLFSVLLIGAWLDRHPADHGDWGFLLVALLGDVEGDTLVRVIVGFIIGAGAAHLMYREPVSEGGASILERASPKTQTLIASVGGVLLAFALLAPYFDRWLTSAEDIKLMGFELKVGQIGTAEKIMRPQTSEAHFVDDGFYFIALYPTNIENDIALITVVQLMPVIEQLHQKPVPPTQKQFLLDRRDQHRQEIRELDLVKRFIRSYLSPIGQCAIRARYAGASRHAVQVAISPVAESLRVAMTVSSREIKEGEFKEGPWSERFFDAVSSTRKALISFTGNERGCPEIAPWPWTATDGAEGESILDTLRQYPYVYVALEKLLVFEGDLSAAIRILSLAQRSPFLDYNYYLYYAFNLSSQTGATIDQYIQYYEGLLKEATDNLVTIEENRGRIKDHRSRIGDELSHCDPSSCGQYGELKERDNLLIVLDKVLEKLEARADTAKLYAMNGIAFGAARDKAAGAELDKETWRSAQEYAKTLLKEGSDIDQFYDTYAFVTLLTEAEKAKPDRATLRPIAQELWQRMKKQEAKIKTLDKTTMQEGDAEDDEWLWSAVDRAELKTYREHLKATENLLSR
jgi:hypothetical protein